MSGGGALAGVRIIEMEGIGPAPFAGMMLADHGAEVIRVGRPGGSRGGVPTDASSDVLARSRRTVAVDLKSAKGVDVVRRLARTADGLIEGFRPGVMERLGLGPEPLLADNTRLVFGRMTGWGQNGPMAHAAGHDINYIALAGALHAFGRAGEKPTPPINMVGDFGGGGMLLAFGMVSAILHARGTGEGQVVDCAMTDGAALLMSMIWSLKAEGRWRDERGVNLLDTGAPFYDTYETQDGKYVSIGSIEPQFYALLVDKAGLGEAFSRQMAEAEWPSMAASLAGIFRQRTRNEWCALMEGTDVCFAPVLSLSEAPGHAHNRARETFVEAGGVIQPAPAPKFSRTPPIAPTMCGAADEIDAILRSCGLQDGEINDLRARRVVA